MSGVPPLIGGVARATPLIAERPLSGTSLVGQSLPNGTLVVGSVSNVAAAVTISGDATVSNTGVLTLATVNGNVGSFTNTNLTVDAKGRITAASSGTAPATTIGDYMARTTNTGTYAGLGDPLIWEVLTASSGSTLTYSAVDGSITTSEAGVFSIDWMGTQAFASAPPATVGLFVDGAFYQNICSANIRQIGDVGYICTVIKLAAGQKVSLAVQTLQYEPDVSVVTRNRFRVMRIG